MSGTPDRRAGGRGLEEKRQRLRRLLAEEKRAPLSFSQQRLWFLDRFEPGSSVYNIPLPIRLLGRLDPVALERSLGELVRRHETLRTTFKAVDGQPVQVIAPAVSGLIAPATSALNPRPPAASTAAAQATTAAEQATAAAEQATMAAGRPEIGAPPLRTIDLLGLPASERQSELERTVAGEAARPFDLGQGPLLRTTLVRLAEEEHVLLMVFHHIIADGWSLDVFFRELGTLYESFRAGRESPLPALPIQYADFARWQRKWFTGDILRQQLGYWRDRLAGSPPGEMPADYARPPVQTFNGALKFFSVDAAVSERLRELASRERTTLFMVLLAAFKVLLHSYTGQEDILVGTPVANRNRAETEGLIGFFANTLVLRTDLSGTPTFTELLGRVRETALGAYDHQDLPFEMLVEEMQPARNLGRSPLFQVMFVHQSAPRPRLELEGLRAEVMGFSWAAAKFDLTLAMRESEGGLAGSFEYNTDLYDESTVAGLARHFGNLLADLGVRADRPLTDLRLMDKDELDRLVVTWNDTWTDYPDASCVHELFEEQARERPEAPAVLFGEEELSYGELDRRAAELALRLRRLGVGPESRVAVCAERSLEMVVGILGTLKAGGAYVPLDPGYPPERLSFMLEDSGAVVLLTQSRLAGRLPETTAEVVYLDGQEDGAPPLENGPEHGPRVTPDGLCYVIYTSGSTGRPKGVAVPHRAVVRLVRNTNYMALGRDEVFLGLASASFDASTQELWGPLLNGGRLALMPPGVPSLEEIGRFVQGRGVTTAWLTAALFNLMIEGQAASLKGLRQLLFGGEAASLGHVRRALVELPGCRLINGYGPTENTTATTCGQVSEWREALLGGRVRSVPIGRPIANTTVYVLDSRMAPAPTGAPGELYTGGEGLARGYLARPDLTAERFVPDPFGEKPGGRLYRTGDLVRYLPDGNLEFLGRLDSQVKVRGFRVEPGEIEAVLSEHPAVREAAVVAREISPGDRRLVAYVTLAGPAQPPAAPGQPTHAAAHRKLIGELRAFLAGRLPDYMAPSAWVVLAALPLTASGKVDRLALPEPERSGPAAGSVPPRTPVEELLAGLWAELLGCGEVGIRGDFFELGGHSLLATRVVARVRQVFGVEVPLKVFFSEPTVEALASRVEEARRGGVAPGTLPLAATPRAGELEVSFAQRRLWFLDRFEPESAAYNIPLPIHLAGRLDSEALRRSLAELVRRHETLRTSLPALDGRPVQVIAAPGPVPVNEMDLSNLPEPERRETLGRIVSEETNRPFDLARGPLMRVTLVRLAGEEHVLVVVLHHVIADGWSLGVFFRELAALYESFLAGEGPSLEELPIQYADFARWQRQWLTGEVLEGQLGYWKERLAGSPPALEVPTDRPRPPAQTFKGATTSFRIDHVLAGRLRELSRRAGATLFMILLAAFQVLLRRYTGQDDVLVGTPVANRNRTETEGLIGFFVNTLVLRTDLSGDPTFTELLGRVRETALGAYDHQDLPFEMLVEELQPVRDPSRSPVFQVMFVFQNTPKVKLELEGLRVEAVEFAGTTAKFDLLLAMAERESGLVGSLEYSTDLYDGSTVARLAGHFGNLLAAIAADPERRLSELGLLDEDELERIVVGWNNTEAEYPDGLCVHELFEERARRKPEAPAVLLAEEELSYGELDLRAERLATRLRALGIGPESRVALCAERSLEMVVGVLGTLKAGGACVPLDPEYPAERLSFMLKDSGAEALLVQSGLAGRLPKSGAKVVYLDEAAPAGARPTGASAVSRGADAAWSGTPAGAGPSPGVDPGPRVTSDNLCYVIYTSGSTGWPKAVAMAHRPLVNLLAWQRRQPSPREGTGDDRPGRTLQFAALSFDVSFQEMFSTWSEGGTLVLVSEEERRDLFGLPTLLRRKRVERFYAPYVALRQVAEACVARGEFPVGLREVITAGERLVVTGAITRLFEELKGCVLGNQYGPSESHVVTAETLAGEPGDWPRLPPIGRPVSNARVHILDPGMRPAPVGVRGEIYLGGTALARGYLDRPDLTGERFVPDPFAAFFGESGARLYRTGDLARYLPGGKIEFLGRADDQVKIRGFRVEPGEVEAVLGRHPAVREVAVTAREVAPGDPRLVAYVVPGGPAGAVSGALAGAVSGAASLGAPGESGPLRAVAVEELFAELRSFLSGQLPDYMIPAAWVGLPALPITPSGKLDRKALPAPDGSGLEVGFAPPRTPVEELVAGMWAGLLGRGAVGVRSGFFELGGHSLLATRVLSRVRQVFGVEISLREFFAGPTVEVLSARIEEARRGGTTGGELPLAPAPRDGDLEVSFAQQRLWFLGRLEPESAAYNMPMPIRLLGRLDSEALDRSLAELVRRHETLRTSFAALDGRPVQVIALAGPVAVERVDLSNLPAPGREEKLQRIISREAVCLFDLARGPLMRVNLVRLAEEEHVLMIVLHHVVADGWSLGVLFRELAILYKTFLAGGKPSLEELPIQYADFARWQRRWLTGEVLGRQMGYWRERLAGSPPALEVPTDRPRQPVQTFKGAVTSFEIDGPVAEHLREISQREGVTLFMVLLAAFKVLLRGYSGQDDILVGTPVANRNRAETEGLIGFFANTLVLRTDLSGDPSFTELLGRVRETTLGAYDHQDLPFEMLVEELRPARDLSRPPLFQVMFVFQNMPTADPELEGLRAETLELAGTTAKVDLLLAMGERESGLAGSLEYSTDLYDGSTIARLAGHFGNLLAAVAAGPERRLSELGLLDEDEFERIVVGWNSTEVDYPDGLCVHELFEEQARSRPGAPAALSGGEALTYGELDLRAECLAKRLRALGVGPETRVAVCAERSLEMVVGVLGTLKAGGAYVPLDPEYPPERLSFMLEDSGARVLLTQSGLAGRLLAPRIRVEYLDGVARAGRGLADAGAASTDAGAGAGEPPGMAPGPRVAPDNLCYVIYTSGSTGRPKGVAMAHRPLVNLLTWQRRQTSPRDGAAEHRPGRTLQFAALSFDVSFQEMFSTWSEGGTLVLAGEGERRNLPGLPALLRETKVERFYAPYVVLRQVAETCAARNEFPVGLREVITAGEQLVVTRAIVRLFQELEGCVFQNHYGPSESHVVSAQALEGEPGSWPRLPPIGRPISNARVHILDAGMRPAPIGVRGEIYLGGVALARGYLDRPDLTAERFGPDPFGELFGAPGARLYRTGDLGRYLPGGNLEFLGRADSQVKIRGFRVEPGEVEAVLGRHPAVSEVAVVAREAAPGDRRLVAYVVPVEPAGATSGIPAGAASLGSPRQSGPPRAMAAAEDLAAALRSFLAGQLPDYMIPAVWVSLPALPLTPSGKLDRRALPDHAGARPGLGAAYAPPRTGNERLVAGLWREALGIERVGLEDNFFDLGGHSLLVTRVAARLSAAFDRDIPVVEMFRHTTVRALAAYLSGNGEGVGAPARGGARGDERKDRPAEAGRERAERRRRLRQASETAPRSGRGASGSGREAED